MIIDIVVVVILLISAVIAFLRGLVRELLTIAGVAGGLASSYFGGHLLTPLMRSAFGVTEDEDPERLFGIFPHDVVADALSYGAIFIIVVIILSIISHYLAETIKKIGLGAIDRTFGFIFGLLRGIVILGLLYMPAHLFIDVETKDKYMEDSKTRIYLEKTSQALATFIPEGTSENARENINQISESLDARGKLEEIDLLKEYREREESPPPGAGNTESDTGYDAKFRQQMDQLIEQQTGTQ